MGTENNPILWTKQRSFGACGATICGCETRNRSAFLEIALQQIMRPLDFTSDWRSRSRGIFKMQHGPLRQEKKTEGATGLCVIRKHLGLLCWRLVVLPDAYNTSKESPDLDRTLNHVMEIFVLPEVNRRQQRGMLPKPAPLWQAQVVFYPDDRPNEIRLNGEVRARAKAILSEPVKPGSPVGTAVTIEQVERWEDIELHPEDDANCGHITLLRCRAGWVLAFDAIYNKERAADHVGAAEEFLESARLAQSQELVRPMVDNLFSACELAMKAILLTMPDPGFLKKATHKAIHRRASKYYRRGSVPSHLYQTYNRLRDLRGRARYLKGEFLDEASMFDGEIENVRELISLAVSWINPGGRKNS